VILSRLAGAVVCCVTSIGPPMDSTVPQTTPHLPALPAPIEALAVLKSWSWSGVVATSVSWGLAPLVLCAVVPLAATIIVESVPHAKRSPLAAPAAPIPFQTFSESTRGAGAFAIPSLARASQAEPAIASALPTAAAAPAFKMLPELRESPRPIVSVKLAEPGTAVPLGLPRRLFEDMARDSILLVTGLPPGATLSSGHLLDSSGLWVVDPRVATSLTLATAAPPQRRHDLRIDVLPPDGLISTLAFVQIEPSPSATSSVMTVRPAAVLQMTTSREVKREPPQRAARVQTAALAKTQTDARPSQSITQAARPATARKVVANKVVEKEKAEKPVREEKREEKTSLPQFLPAAVAKGATPPQKPTVQVATLSRGTPIARLGATQPAQPSPNKPDQPVWTKPWARAVFSQEQNNGGN
jgi:hypothetical protein